MNQLSRGKRVFRFAWVAMGLLAAASTGCSGEQGGEVPGERKARAVRAATPELAVAVRGNDDLAWAIYREARQAEQDLFFSPFSIGAALAMTYAGARGETAAEMRAVLGIPEDDSTYHEAFAELVLDLSGEVGRGYDLFVANKLFGQRDYPFAPEFLEFTGSRYGAPLTEVDYAGAPDAARDAVNAWVSEQTRDKIPELVGEGDIDALTRLTLANAVYFDAPWFSRFDPEKTMNASFLMEDGTERSVAMMRQKSRFRVGGDAAFDALELDYADRELAMLILLPVERGGLPSVESELDAERVAAIAASLSEQDIELQLPRFEIRGELPLSEILKSLGMPSAFDARRADFSGMLAGDPSSNERLFVQTALHQGYVSVDERGTTAAAATAVVVGTRSANPTFVVDHPFVVVIRDKLTGASLFVGRVANPG